MLGSNKDLKHNVEFKSLLDEAVVVQITVSTPQSYL